MLASVLLRHLYPLAFGGGVAVHALAHLRGWPLQPAVMAWVVAVVACGAWLERRAPFEPAWNAAGGDTRDDLLSAAVLIGLADPLAQAAVLLLATHMLAHTPWLTGSGAGGWALAPLPWPLQLGLAVLLADFGRYAMHRLHHRWPLLWRLHAMHHAPHRLYWLNNFRFHPLNAVLNTLAALLPLTLLGAPEWVLTGVVAWTLPVMVLQHLNARTCNGWANALFSTNELHRWHHSDRAGEGDRNLGATLIIWDRLLGTFHAAQGRPSALGLYGDGADRYPVRGGYCAQLRAGVWPSQPPQPLRPPARKHPQPPPTARAAGCRWRGCCRSA